MGKQSDFERNSRDFYPTPMKGALPLIRMMERQYSSDNPIKFIEPFAGDGALTDHLTTSPVLECVYEADIEPQHSRINQHDYKDVPNEFCATADYFISNPPWINSVASGRLLFTLINNLSTKRPTWLLLDGGFAFNLSSGDYMRYCSEVIPVGRLKWIPDSKYSGKEDCAWFLFDKTDGQPKQTVLHPREKWI